MNRPPLIYVAGPISGDPWGCVRQAIDAFDLLRDVGAVPFLPQLSVLHAMIRETSYEDFMAYDFDVIRCADALVRLPGESPGADREVAFAHEIGTPVFEWETDHGRAAAYRFCATWETAR